jgi:peptidoglycan/LPS O-acetylase OafA/YrhL
MKFRSDINGLRAIAVIAVVLFHFGVPGFSGGFIGVDVFFVISGYLMTGIIFSKIEKKSFSLVGFYLDRGRRIIPALLFVCIAVLILGWLFLLPADFRALGKDVASSVSFLSNIIYFRTSGDYFSASAHEMWLLHTWSLAVEWQFYIIYPIIVLALSRLFNLKKLKVILVILAINSYLYSIYLSNINTSAAFYLLPTRAWEMLLGGFVFLWPINTSVANAKKLEYLGIALILVSIFTFESTTLWPGSLAIIPTLGTALIIWANSPNSCITSNPLSFWVGKNSYSIYLWHWPLVVALVLTGFNDKVLAVLSGIMLSLFLGYLSFKYIESIPWNKLSNKIFVPAFGCLILTVGGGASFIYLKNGIEGRHNRTYIENTKDIVMPLKNNGWCFYSVDSIKGLEISEDGNNCFLGDDNGNTEALLIGDSYAGHWEPFWDRVGKNNGIKIRSVTTNYCYPSLTNNFPYTGNKSFKQCLINRQFLKDNVNDYDVIILSGMWNSDKLLEVEQVINFIKKYDKKIIIMPSPVKYDLNVGKRYLYTKLFDIPSSSMSFPYKKDEKVSLLDDKLQTIINGEQNSFFISRYDAFSLDNGNNVSPLSRENIPYSLDGGHLSVYGAIQAAINFEESNQYSRFIEFLYK